MYLPQPKQLALACGLAITGFAGFTFAAPQELAPLKVYANTGSYTEFNAPFATEIHTSADISNSGAISIYDYLGKHSSVNVSSGAGNEFQQKLDMRGYGIGDGYQNLVVTLNGRRLNNIDMQSQLLGNIPLASIERIEILKGSGSVASGDGAMAGTINIVTKDSHGVDVSLAAGNKGYLDGTLVAGITEEFFALQVTADKKKSDGFRDRDLNSKKDKSDAENFSTDLKITPIDEVEIRLGADRSRLESIYGSPLTLSEFNSNPKQPGQASWPPNSLNKYTEQELKTDVYRLGTSIKPNQILSFHLDYAKEKKEVEFVSPSSNPSKYNYQNFDFASEVNLEHFKLRAGVHIFDGDKKDPNNKTTKDNQASFLQANYNLDDFTLNVGVRHEKVKYKYSATSENTLKDSEKLTAWELGFNQQLSREASLFANFTSGYQAPDINRFFNFGGIFNDFIKPAKHKTLNLGFNHLTANNKFKATIFYSRLTNEIYYYSLEGKNTNLDKSYKYGLELQDRWQLNESLSANFNYSYTLAKIDKENEGGGAYNGKKLPGVSSHTASLGLYYKVVTNGRLSLTHKWRSKAYAEADFENKISKAKAFNSTNLGYSHQINNFTLFAQIDNLFDKKNGAYLYADYIDPTENVVYPLNFTRTWYAGVKASF